MSLSQVQRILQLLLAERVPVRQLGSILEALGDYAPRTTNLELLSEYVRGRLARTISAKYRDVHNRLHVVTLETDVEQHMRESIDATEHGSTIRISPDESRSLSDSIRQKLSGAIRRDYPPILLVSPDIRRAMKQITMQHVPELVVLSHSEVTRDTDVVSVGMVTEQMVMGFSTAGIARPPQSLLTRSI